MVLYILPTLRVVILAPTPQSTHFVRAQRRRRADRVRLVESITTLCRAAPGSDAVSNGSLKRAPPGARGGAVRPRQHGHHHAAAACVLWSGKAQMSWHCLQLAGLVGKHGYCSWDAHLPHLAPEHGRGMVRASCARRVRWPCAFRQRMRPHRARGRDMLRTNAFVDMQALSVCT